MARLNDKPSRLADWLPPTPFHLAAAGMATSALAACLHLVPGEPVTVLRVALLVAGLLLAGGAVWWKIRTMDDSFDERCQTAIAVALAGGAVLGSWLAMDKEWDSLRLALMVLWGLSLLGVVLVLLPVAGRKVAVSLLVLFHFGGILTTVTAVGAGNYSAPYIPSVLWNRVYRNYLQFSYLMNAYHFYSPEPGPPTLVWFRVEFEGDVQPYWERLVSREECSTRLQYQRLLALTESTNTYWPYNSANKVLALNEWRQSAARFDRSRALLTSPLVQLNYRELNPLSKKYLASYVRFVARKVREEQHPDLKVRAVKVYRLTHNIINAPQLQAGVSPLAKWLYSAYYLGEYTPEGKLMSPDPKNLAEKDLTWVELMPDGVTRRTLSEPKRDPFLYWQLPIYVDPHSGKLVDGLEAHARLKTANVPPAPDSTPQE